MPQREQNSSSSPRSGGIPYRPLVLTLQARAIENMMFVAACNRVGTANGTLFGGHSMVVDPWGEVLYQGGMTEDFVFVEIDTSKVKKARGFLRYLR